MPSPQAPTPSVRARMGEVIVWNHAVQIQAYRVLSEAPWPIASTATQHGDAYLFALALRNLIRAVKFVRAKAHRVARPRIDAALGEFDATIPNAANIRDILEHFDQYKVGSGRLQQGTSGAGRPTVQWHERNGETHILWVALAGRQPFRLDVAAAQEAAATLVERVEEAVRPEPAD